jgi:hypothetical protein
MKHIKVRWLGTIHMLVLGACWRQAQAEKQGVFGKESVCKESDKWKETKCVHIQETRMHRRKTQ